MTEHVQGRTFTVSGGRYVFTLEEAPEGGYIVTSPLDPGVTTQGETMEQALEMGRDAFESLQEARRKLLDQPRSAG